MQVLVSTGVAYEGSPGECLASGCDTTGPPRLVNAHCHSLNPVSTVPPPLGNHTDGWSLCDDLHPLALDVLWDTRQPKLAQL